jgi:nucleoside-diphosphate-sugar epimerase
MSKALAADLDHVLDHTAELWEDLRGGRLFITGGTGFFGRWLLESFRRANERLGLGAGAVVLTRNPAAFRRDAPDLAAYDSLALHEGDVRTFDYPDGAFTHVIHAATPATTPADAERLLLLDTIVRGTRRALDFARHSGARKFLLTSSGAVYGRQPPELTHLAEDYLGAPDALALGSEYGEGKRVAEHLCGAYHRLHGLETKIARCFAFVGPYLPLDGHFAVGNFARDGLAGGPIRVEGDGTPWRSYLYAADLMVWLWTLLLRAPPARAYNVGAEEAVTIAQLAQQVASCCGTEVQIARPPTPGAPAPRYVPSTRRAREELDLRAWVGLEEAIERTLRWHRS